MLHDAARSGFSRWPRRKGHKKHVASSKFETRKCALQSSASREKARVFDDFPDRTHPINVPLPGDGYLEINLASQLDWRPGGGVVAHVPPEQVPSYDLPPEASKDQLDGKPAFHVTLIAKDVMLPYAAALASLWSGIADSMPEPPVVQLSPRLRVAVSEEKQRKSWFVDVLNADEYRQFVSALAGAIDSALRAVDYPPFINRDAGRYFHVTIANDQGGDPMKSLSNPQEAPGS